MTAPQYCGDREAFSQLPPDSVSTEIAVRGRTLAATETSMPPATPPAPASCVAPASYRNDSDAGWVGAGGAADITN